MINFSQMFSLEGKRAVVTGAGRGIGRAIAKALAAAGAEVLVHFNASRDGAVQTLSEIQHAGGTGWIAQADLSRSEDATRLFDAVCERWGALDILVNNAGDLVQRCKLGDFSDELLETVLRTNIHTAIYSSRAALPLLKRGVDPAILLLGSVAAHTGGSNGGAVYAASKGAIHTLTRGLAKELAPHIRVNAISPGLILTDFHQTHSTPEAREDARKRTPLGRNGEADDLGPPAVFLCSRGAAFITGEILEVNGGMWVA